MFFFIVLEIYDFFFCFFFGLTLNVAALSLCVRGQAGSVINLTVHLVTNKCLGTVVFSLVTL